MRRRGYSLRRCCDGGAVFIVARIRRLGLAGFPGARLGIVTRGVGLLPPNHYLAVAVWYLFQNRPSWKASASVGKTLVSSSMIDRVASHLERELAEVPVGFKWFVDGLLDGSVPDEIAHQFIGRIAGCRPVDGIEQRAVVIENAQCNTNRRREPRIARIRRITCK